MTCQSLTSRRRPRYTEGPLANTNHILFINCVSCGSAQLRLTPTAGAVSVREPPAPPSAVRSFRFLAFSAVPARQRTELKTLISFYLAKPNGQSLPARHGGHCLGIAGRTVAFIKLSPFGRFSSLRILPVACRPRIGMAFHPRLAVSNRKSHRERDKDTQ